MTGRPHPESSGAKPAGLSILFKKGATAGRYHLESVKAGGRVRSKPWSPPDLDSLRSLPFKDATLDVRTIAGPRILGSGSRASAGHPVPVPGSWTKQQLNQTSLS